MKRFIYILLAVLLAGCRQDFPTLSDEPAGEIAVGEPVQFTTLMTNPVVVTRTAAYDDWKNKIDSFYPATLPYEFRIEMWHEGDDAPVDTSYYTPARPVMLGEVAVGAHDGTLEYDFRHSLEAEPLYWQDSQTKWGFRATTVSADTIEADQSDQEKWLRQDKMTGYSYLPIWNETLGEPVDLLDRINYRTSKQWYADNHTAQSLSGLMVENNNDYKKIPLYFQHERAWISIILRAGEGVKREALKFATASENIAMTINSYDAEHNLAIDNAWARQEYIDYPKDPNGEAESHVSTTRYEAIVMPHNYATRKDEEIIARIQLSGQNFSFYASNDTRYVNGTNIEEANAAYNLEAGKHLTIEATLSRESRKILITAWIEDWTEVATQTICDDYGQNGDPIVIKSRAELIAFLSDEKLNKQGNVGIIQPTSLNLDIDGEDWSSNYDLNATLNLAGCVLKTGHRLFNNMSSSANLVNGTVLITDGAVVDCAIANTNDGTIERVNITTTGETTTAHATVAGMVGTNHGTISQCSSSLPVLGTTGITESEMNYIGGIAAVSKNKDASSMAVIDGCVVNAAVGQSTPGTLYGGGIAGYATGRVSNNTFEYGITCSQDPLYYKNIFAQAGSVETRAYGNSWPTTALNPIHAGESTNPNNYSGTKFDAVLDSQAELDHLLINGNSSDKYYRISKSFTVSSDTWTHGKVDADNITFGVDNPIFHLDGNGKTITLTGNKTVTTTDGSNHLTGKETTYTTTTMLFNCILGEIDNLVLYLDRSLVAQPAEALNTDDNYVYNASDAIAPLAYAVYGTDARVNNVRVIAADTCYVQAATPGGLVAWVYGGATVSDCKVNVPVHMWLPAAMGGDAKHYAGGIAACAAQATITECVYLGIPENSVSGSKYSSSAKSSFNFYYGGIVGGTATKSSETPKLVLTDCTSWFLAKRTTSEDPDQSTRAGIIGYSCYAESSSSSTIRNGMAEGNMGNWWQLSSPGVGYWLPTLTEEAAIGKRNAVTPTYNTDIQ